MKEIDKKIDIILEKAGQINGYQFLVTFIFLIQLICVEFINQSLHFLERVPFVFINDSKKSTLINHKICNNESLTYKIDSEKGLNSIVIDFNIFCNKEKIFFLGFSIYIGMIIGSCCSYIFVDSIGRKRTLIIFVPINILFLCTYKFISPDFEEWGLYLVYINFFISGFCNIIIIVTMIIYICEIIKQNNIPVFVIIIITGIPLSNLFGTLLFNITNFDWRYVLLIIAGINAIIYFIMIFKLVRSPIFSLNNELFEPFIFDLMELAKRNKLNLDLNDFSFLLPYINNETRRTIRIKYDRMNKESVGSLYAINKVSLLEEKNDIENNEEEEESLFNDSSKSNNFLIKEDYCKRN